MGEGTIIDLMAYFREILDKFLIHRYIKRRQAKTFETDRKSILESQSQGKAQLQIYFAEKFTCLSQDKIQSAHWNQKLVSKFAYFQ